MDMGYIKGFSLLLLSGYATHPSSYGMGHQIITNNLMSQAIPEYTNGYGYGPNAYQCGGPYSMYSSSVSSPYSPTTTSCYAMPPPQHLTPHEKLLKDG